MAAQRTSKHPLVAAAAGVVLLASSVGLAGCSAQSPSGVAATTPSTSTASAAPAPRSTEVSPAGDIPDNQAYVAFTSADRAFSVSVPEGWAETATGSTTIFTDKLNMISLIPTAVASAPTVDSARQADVSALNVSEQKFALTNITPFTRPGGSGVEITYSADSPVNQVTGSVVRNQVERYLFWRGGKQVAVVLTSPQGSDNVDPWAKVTGSFAWSAK